MSFLLFSCQKEEESLLPEELESLLAMIDLDDPAAFAPRSGDRGNLPPAAKFALDGEGDPFLAWNQIMLDSNARDHALSAPDQAGPTRTSRAFAMVHLAMFEAANATLNFAAPYLATKARSDVNAHIAVGTAAHRVLIDLFPHQRGEYDRALREDLLQHIDDESFYRSVALGRYVGRKVLAERRGDGSEHSLRYVERRDLGRHQVDPLHPEQGFLDPAWGSVKPFFIKDLDSLASPPPPSLGSAAYAAAYEEVRRLGGDGRNTPTDRTPEQTAIGIYWGYDGTPGLGTPPRLYNQIVREIARQSGNLPLANAVLFTLINSAMADAGIASWKDKWNYAFWRPIVAIRAGEFDGNAATRGDRHWTPLGSPASNTQRSNFTPNFPAYTSGHATFGAATFRSVANFYGRDAISFSFVSDEFNGQTRDASGSIRPRLPRRFSRLSQATEENGQSRIYLGIHWSFDKTEGIRVGEEIADRVCAQLLDGE